MDSQHISINNNNHYHNNNNNLNNNYNSNNSNNNYSSNISYILGFQLVLEMKEFFCDFLVFYHQVSCVLPNFLLFMFPGFVFMVSSLFNVFLRCLGVDFLVYLFSCFLDSVLIFSSLYLLFFCFSCVLVSWFTYFNVSWILF